MKALKKALSVFGNGKKSFKRTESVRPAFDPYTPLDFEIIQAKANAFADKIEHRFEELAHILLEYESYEVVQDEIERTLDILRSLKENEEYFKLRVGPVAAFLPRNQPLYALTCFVIVPSFMASEVHFRIPHSMRHFMPKMLALLDIYTQFPNVIVSHKKRVEFLLERSALMVNPKTKETIPVTDAAIFTGTSAHADQLRLVFDNRTLFISNGSGHNPLVISKDADLDAAIEATLALTLYNQGQDCAAPNAILVHKDVFSIFLRKLRDGMRSVGVGQYRDRTSRVGPISDPKDLVRIQDFLIRHREWLDASTPGIIRAQDATLEPTIITKPLKEGGNFTEIFAPVIFLQEYEKDADLALYFEDIHYAPNAMFVTVYGTSRFVESLEGREIRGRVLHESTSIFRNKHLHAKGSERGTQPYGGNGYGASSYSINGKITAKATLPQRDIYECVAKPILASNSIDQYRNNLSNFTSRVEKDVQKILRLKSGEEESRIDSTTTGVAYVDIQGLQFEGVRYAKLNDEVVYRLREYPDVEYIANLEFADREMVRALHDLLSEKELPLQDDLKTRIYAIAKLPGSSEEENKARQLRLFQHVYQLLFGTSSGPRLAQFFSEIDRGKACELLDV